MSQVLYIYCIFISILYVISTYILYTYIHPFLFHHKAEEKASRWTGIPCPVKPDSGFDPDSCHSAALDTSLVILPSLRRSAFMLENGELTEHKH